MLSAKELWLDNASVGAMKLCEVRPAYDYKDGVRQADVSGYRYVVVLMEHGLEKISVTIPGPQLIEFDGDYKNVVFDGLKVRPYVGRDGKLAVTATATGVKFADENHKK